MRHSIDQSTDYSNKELYSYLTGINLPNFLKQASIEETKDDGVMQKEAFADPAARLFPMNTPARIYVSTAHFLNKCAELAKLRGKAYTEKVADSLDLAATIFGIRDEVSDLVKHAYLTDEAEYVDNSVVLKIAQDHVDLFTIKTAQDLANAAGTFVEKIANYPFEWRRAICEQFVKAAEQLNVDDLPELVLKYAGQYYPDIVAVKEELARRMTKVSATDKERYTQLIGDVNNIGDKEEVFKLAECCYFTEKNAGLYNKYQSRSILGDPVDKFFTLHFNKVAEMLDVVEMGGEKFAMTDLKKVSADKFEEAFGFPVDIKSAEVYDILPTMPKSDVALFKHLSGIRPI